MKASLGIILDQKKAKVNQLLEEAEAQYFGIPEARRTKTLKFYINESEQGEAIVQIMKEVASLINPLGKGMLFVCEDYTSYLKQIEAINEAAAFPFEHDWEESWNHRSHALYITVVKDYVVTFDTSEAYDLHEVDAILKG